jgi:hypothetical protein
LLTKSSLAQGASLELQISSLNKQNFCVGSRRSRACPETYPSRVTSKWSTSSRSPRTGIQ